MATYISLVKFTEKGLAEIRQTGARLDVTKVGLSAMGGELVAFYGMMGKYDALLISEVPDDDTAFKIELINEFKGFARTETYRAFTEDEYRKVIASMPEDRGDQD